MASNSNLFSWLTLEMMNIDDYHANSRNFHELAKSMFWVESVFMDFLSLWFLGQLLIVIIVATWNVNACYYEVSYASARSLRMRRSTPSALGP